MSDETETPEAVVDPLDALVAVANEPEPEAQEGDQDSDPELFEVEVGPEKYKVPKPFKEAWDGMQGAHTQRSQTVAEKEREIEATKASIAEQQKFLRTFTDEVAELRGIHPELQKYQGYTQADWDRFNAEDAENTSKHLNRFRALQMRAETLANGIQTKSREAEAKEKQDIELRVAKLNAELTTRIKDWSPQKATELQTFVQKDYGIPEDIVKSIAIAHPGVAQMAHDAWMLRQIQARAKKAAAPALVPLPVKKAGGGASKASNDLRDSDTPEEWLRKRNAQEAKLRAH